MSLCWPRKKTPHCRRSNLWPARLQGQKGRIDHVTLLAPFSDYLDRGTPLLFRGVVMATQARPRSSHGAPIVYPRPYKSCGSRAAQRSTVPGPWAQSAARWSGSPQHNEACLTMAADTPAAHALATGDRTSLPGSQRASAAVSSTLAVHACFRRCVHREAEASDTRCNCTATDSSGTSSHSSARVRNTRGYHLDALLQRGPRALCRALREADGKYTQLARVVFIHFTGGFTDHTKPTGL